MEVVHNMVTGCFRPSPIQDEPGESEDEDGDEIQWLGYNEVTQLGHGKSLVPYNRPKRYKGELVHIQSGNIIRVAGSFHFHEPWWQTTILRTKKSKAKFIEPKDGNALCYRLRDDSRTKRDRLFDLFISKVGETTMKMPDGKKLEVAPWFEGARRDFEAFLSCKYSEDDLDLLSMESFLDSYIESFSEELRKVPIELKSKDVHKYQHLLLKIALLNSIEFQRIQVAQEHPNLFHYLPQLFPGNFVKLLSIDMKKLSSLSTLIEEEPGFLAFKKIVSKECGIMGCETSYEALQKAGLMPKIEQDIRDAILMYEFIKKETKENGHTYIQFNRILDVLGSVVQQFEEALIFLNKNKVTKTQVEGGNRIVYLTQLWQAENKIAVSLNSLVVDGERVPWELKVDFDSEDFDSIRSDNYQLQAAKLIATKPVVAISGKGGCGKTYVVTKVITAAKNRKKKGMENAEEGDEDTQPNNDDDSMTQPNDEFDITDNNESQGSDDADMVTDPESGHDNNDEDKPPKSIELLLTAPTGKAANLLGKRAKCPSFTLHQVIYSFRNLKEGMPWRHKDVNVLVVDECSLVSVSTFSFLIELLMEHAKLRRIVLLGDIRQLPSIEPGNFLSDTFSSLCKIGCGVELRNNHRAESELIVNNATKISQKVYPVFHEEQFVFRKLPSSNLTQSGDDYTESDISEEVRKLLQHEALQNHVKSQFISFTRRVCDSINDLCCKHYSNHRTKDYGKFIFRTGDKICCTKNGYVNLYEDNHGVMTCYSQNDQSLEEEESEGGVNRLVHADEDTSLLETQLGNQSGQNGILNTTVSSSKTDEKKEKKPNQIRLCNGEIFFILEEIEKKDDENRMRTFLLLSDKDTEKEFIFYVDKQQLRKSCKIRHAWARTIHTFQGSETDTVVYIVGNGSWRQNWQHVYTAVTRGRKSVFIIGQDLILRKAIKRSEIKRQTSLRKQLVEKLQKNMELNLNASMNVQNSTLNTTALNSTTNQGPSKKQMTLTQVVRSYDQTLHPTKNVVTSNHGDNTLNNTQMVTDVLTSLAEDHNVDADGVNDDDCASDSSESLLSEPKTSNKNSRTQQSSSDRVKSSINKSSKGDNHVIHSNDKLDCDDVDSDIEDIECKESDIISDEEMDNISEPDSDDSPSLISPPVHRSKSLTRSDRSTVNDQVDGRTCGEPSVFTHLKSKNKPSQLSLKKGKMPLTMISNSSLSDACVNGNVNKSNHSNVNKGRLSLGKSRSSVKVDKINPGDRNTNFKTSNTNEISSSNDISSTNGTNTLFTDQKSKNVSMAGQHPFSMSTPEPSALSRLKGKGRLSVPDDLKEPKSNESMQSNWSDVDDSFYLDLDEGINVKDEGNDQTGRDGGGINGNSRQSISRLVNIPDFGSCRKSIGANESTNSQWSEMSDEHYLTLDLDDIKEMDPGNHGNGEICDNNDGRSIKGEESISAADCNQEYSNTDWRDSEELIPNTPPSPSLLEAPSRSIPGTPPSPNILDTPLNMILKSPSRKRGLILDSNEVNGVSPIKHTLSKLRFK
ncbi:hypothetical protein ACF0H5_008351 [Mactra antiquata]